MTPPPPSRPPSSPRGGPRPPAARRPVQGDDRLLRTLVSLVDDLTVERAMEDIGLNEVTKLRHNLRVLFGVAAIAPMLGLLGSVSGMIQAFYSVSTQWNATGKGETLAKGIYEALTTTYSGLLIAIPSLICYYIFLNKIDAIVSDMNDMSRKFLEHYRTAKAPALSVV